MKFRTFFHDNILFVLSATGFVNHCFLFIFFLIVGISAHKSNYFSFDGLNQLAFSYLKGTYFRENLFQREFIFAIEIFENFAGTYFCQFRRTKISNFRLPLILSPGWMRRYHGKRLQNSSVLLGLKPSIGKKIMYSRSFPRSRILKRLTHSHYKQHLVVFL